jgi:hypothetical protein
MTPGKSIKPPPQTPIEILQGIPIEILQGIPIEILQGIPIKILYFKG